MNAAVDAREFERRDPSRRSGAPERAEPGQAQVSALGVGMRGTRDRVSPGSYEITQPVLFKGHTALAGCILILRALAPSVVAIATLYAIVQWQGLAMTRDFTTLSLLACVLSAVLLQQPRKATTQLLAPEFPAVVGLMLRWGVLLAILLAIGYLTGESADYPRRTHCARNEAHSQRGASELCARSTCMSAGAITALTRWGIRKTRLL